MDNVLYLIHEDDYLDHIDNKLEMYHLLLETVRTLRADLTKGETAQAVRDLCAYEQEAHTLFESWDIADEYVESGDPDDLAQLMEAELLPADVEDDGEMDSDTPAAVRLLRAVSSMTENARAVLAVVGDILEFEGEIDRMLDDMEKPENDCAG